VASHGAITAPGPAKVTFRFQARAFTVAVERFRKASGKHHAQEAWGALNEALNLAAQLDDRTVREWDSGHERSWDWFESIRGAQAIPGMRWVRNAVTHQWADALEFVESTGGRFPSRTHDWIWRPLTEVPGDQRTRNKGAKRDVIGEQQKSYRTYLAGRSADFALSILDECFGEIAARSPVVTPFESSSRAAPHH
jgi:hypothetical protein